MTDVLKHIGRVVMGIAMNAFIVKKIVSLGSF